MAKKKRRTREEREAEMLQTDPNYRNLRKRIAMIEAELAAKAQERPASS